MQTVIPEGKGDQHILTVDLTKDYVPSNGTGKTNTVAGTGGFQTMRGRDAIRFNLTPTSSRHPVIAQYGMHFVGGRIAPAGIRRPRWTWAVCKPRRAG